MPIFHWLKWFVLVAAFVVFTIAGIVLLSRRSEKKRQGGAVMPPSAPDRLLYDRLSTEMMAYAKASNRTVVFHQEVEKLCDGQYILVRTTSDPFGKRCYVERQRWCGDKIQYTLCRYDNGATIPSAHAILEIPASSTAWRNYCECIRDIQERGSKISFYDGPGLHRQEYVPRNAAELRV